MLKQVVELASQILTLARDNQQNKSDIKEVRDEVKAVRRDLVEFRDEMHAMSLEIQRPGFEIRQVAGPRHARA